MIRTGLRLFETAGADFLDCYFYAVELLREAESNNVIFSLKEAAVLIADIAGNNTDEERCISLTENENKVRIANLHKVKGLEAPIVILASPVRNKNDPTYRVADTDDGKKNWIFAIPDGSKNYKNQCKTEQFKDEKEKETACLEAERIRLLYVAATRARSVLIIGRAVSSAKGNQSNENAWSELIDNDIPNIGIPKNSFAENNISASELYIDKNETIFSDLSSLEKTFEIKRPSMLAVKAKTSSEDEFEDADEKSADTERHREDAALIGTIVHRLMELTVISGDKLGRKESVNEIISDFGLEDQKYTDILYNVFDSVHSGGYEQNNGMIKDILPELLNADEVYCEVPFCSKEKGETGFVIWNGVMDVVYRKGDKWYIVDYKTNADTDDLDEKYKNQLKAYIAAFREMTGNTADTLIYHIDIESSLHLV